MRLVVHDLGHRFPGTDLLFERLDFSVEPGTTAAICGPSGCGKSTLLSILAGWEKPYAGSVEREGIARTGWVFQNPVGVAQRTALDHVVFPLLAKGHGPAADTTAGIGSHEVVRFGLCGRPSVQRIVGRRGTASHAGAGRMLETRHAARGRAHSSARHEDRAFGEPCAWQPREPGHDRAGGDA